MAERGRDWLAEAGRYKETCAAELGLRAASTALWRVMARCAGGTQSPATDHFAPARHVISEYLRYTGRYEEAREIEAIGCNEPPGPVVSAYRAALRNSSRLR